MSVGLVFTPTFFRGFSFSIDYFDIKVDQRRSLQRRSLAPSALAHSKTSVATTVFRNPNAEYGFPRRWLRPELSRWKISAL